MQRRAVETREKILKTATALFAKSGFHGASVDRIAEKAGVNKQRLYAYYGNKRGLFEACLVAVYERVNAEEEAALALTEEDIPVMTEVIARHYFSVHKRFPDFRRLLAWANLESAPFYKSLENIKEAGFARLRELYAEGQRRGLFRADVSFEIYIFSLMALGYFYYANRRTLTGAFGEAFFSPQGEAKLIAACPLFLQSSAR